MNKVLLNIFNQLEVKFNQLDDSAVDSKDILFINRRVLFQL